MFDQIEYQRVIKERDDYKDENQMLKKKMDKMIEKYKYDDLHQKYDEIKQKFQYVEYFSKIPNIDQHENI